MIRKTTIFTLLLSCILLLASCGNASSIVGKWEPVERGETMEFYEDGTIIADGESGKYEFSDNELRIMNLDYMGSLLKANAEINGDTLTIIDGDYTAEYKRIKK